MNEDILKNSRQMPSTSTITREKDYCDLLYAWLQVNSERDGDIRTIPKSKVKWLAIEKDFTRYDSEGNEDKIMGRKTIAKYFKHLEDRGLVFFDEQKKCYCLPKLENSSANLIELHTLLKLMNVFQKNSISIYIYLFNRYYATGKQPFIATIAQIKDFIGIATTTTSNNLIIDDTLEILKRLGLLEYQLIYDKEKCKSYLEFQWVKNRLP